MASKRVKNLWHLWYCSSHIDFGKSFQHDNRIFRLRCFFSPTTNNSLMLLNVTWMSSYLKRHSFHSDGFAPIHRACWGDGLLVAAGRTWTVFDPFFLDSGHQHSKVVRSLIEAKNILITKVASMLSIWISIQRCWIKAGVDPQLRASNGSTCLQLQSWSSEEERTLHAPSNFFTFRGGAVSAVSSKAFKATRNNWCFFCNRCTHPWCTCQMCARDQPHWGPFDNLRGTETWEKTSCYSQDWAIVALVKVMSLWCLVTLRFSQSWSE